MLTELSPILAMNMLTKSSADRPGRRCCCDNHPQNKAKGLKARSLR